MPVQTALRLSALTVLCLAVATPVVAGPATRSAEFLVEGRTYETDFQRSVTDLMRIVKEEDIEVLAVAEFSDMDGRPLYIGSVWAEEFSTMMVSASTGKKRARVLDPSALNDFMNDKEDGGNPLTSSKDLKTFGKRTDAEILLTGKIAITSNEARLFLRALNTKTGGIRWASTVVVKGTTPAAAAAAAAAATQPTAAPATAAPAVGAPAVGAPAVAAPTLAAPVVAAPTVQAPAISAPTVAAPRVAAPSISAPSIAAPSIAAPSIAAPSIAAPTVAAAPAPRPEPETAAPRAPSSVTQFDNGVVRATLRSVQKFPDQGWVTAVIDITNLGSAPLALDIAGGDPGNGTDDAGNDWKVERATGLKMSQSPSADMTPLGPQATMPIVLVLTTAGRPLGNRISFSANVLWYSGAAQDGGRLGMNFQNVKL